MSPPPVLKVKSSGAFEEKGNSRGEIAGGTNPGRQVFQESVSRLEL